MSVTELDLGIREKDDWEVGYQPDGSPTLATLSNAVQCWALLQLYATDTTVTVGAAALAFCIPPARVAAAVEWHAWMFLGGDGPNATIEHEGE